MLIPNPQSTFIFILFSYYIPLYLYPYLCIIPTSLTIPVSTCLSLLRSRDSLLTYMITVYLITVLHDCARLLHNTDRSLLELVNTHDDEHNYNITQSPYYTDREMIDLLENKKTFTVMSLNCQSVASKFDTCNHILVHLMVDYRVGVKYS